MPGLRTFTVGTDAHEALVAEDMAAVTDALRVAAPDCDAIVLGGSFGRGEGVVRHEPEPRAVNDYDVLVLGGRATHAVRDVRVRLGTQCRAEGLDVAQVESGAAIGPSQFGFDIRMGARVLYGAPSAVAGWGDPAPASLTVADAWYGLTNRVCGVVHAWPLSGRTEDTERLDGQLAKLGVAIGDALLIGWGDYHHLLAVRQVRSFMRAHRLAA